MKKNKKVNPASSSFNTLFRLTSYLISSLSVLYCFIFVFFALIRLRYPYELGWYEDELLYIVNRILTGEPIYTAPSLSYIPLIYGPVFYFFSAILAYFFGNYFYILRIISIASTISTVILIYAFLVKITKNKSAGLLGMGIFLATFPLGKYSFDVGRVDALFLFFMFSSAFLTLFGRTNRKHVLSALCIVLAVFTKQIALILIFFLTLYYFFENRKYLKTFVIGITLFLLIGFLYMHLAYDGWYTYYTLFLFSSHTIRGQVILSFWFYDLLYPLPVALLSSIFMVIRNYKTHDIHQRFLLYFSAALTGIALLSRAKEGGDVNVLPPVFLIIAIYFGLFYKHIRTMNQNTKSINSIFYSCYFILFILAQMLFLLFWIQVKALPTENNNKQMKILATTIKKTEGDVYLINHRNLLDDTDKTRYAHLHALKELIGLYGNKVPNKEGAVLNITMKELINKKHFGAFIIDSYAANLERMNPFIKELGNKYEISSKIFVPIDNIVYLIYTPKPT